MNPFLRAYILFLDVWTQTTLIDENNDVMDLVDWDRAVWSNPEIEFAALDYCGISEPAIWEGYEKKRDTSQEARIR